ncbi:MAG TPA: MlaD family protein [Flavobacteriaceae bacterium]|nr:MlaD family protein [Flavobacteriaceae bacterium]
MSKSTTQKIRVGVFVIIGTIVLVVALYFIGSRQHIFTKNIQLHAVFENVSGLQIGNNVRYSGINVGTVNKIEMKEVGKIIIQMSVDQNASYFIKKDAVASINSDGLVGSMVVNISPGQEPQELTVASGDTIQSYSSASTEAMLKTLNKTNENAALLTADLLKITNQILEGKSTMGMLMNDTILAKDIHQTIIALKKTSEGANLAMSEINSIISKINYDESAASVILSDTVAADQIRNIFTNLETSTEEVNGMTKNLEEYIAELKTGKGALNHFTQDEDFVKEVDSTMIQIKEASEKLNQNMEALQHNFLFRGFFKKQARKERKAAKKGRKNNEF